MPASAESFDFVIVGAGSAGCVMAHRLSEDGAQQRARAGSRRQRPLGVHPDAERALNPDELAEIRLGLRNGARASSRRTPAARPRGKVMGGSSSINGMVYVRGNALDFDAWEEEGGRAGATATCCPTSSARRRGPTAATSWRGSDGPLHTSYGAPENPALPGLHRGGRQAGYAETEDYQRLPAGRLRPDGRDGPPGPSLERGQCLSQAGHQAAATCPCRSLRHARRIALRGPACGWRRVRHGGPAGRSASSRARREVMLAAGSINSPLLLMLSGIGPGRRPCQARHPSRCTTARAWAKTCRTIWNSISRWSARSRSRSIRR